MVESLVLVEAADGGDERSDLERLGLVYPVGVAPVLHSMRNQVGVDPTGRGLAEGPDLATVAELVAELDDVGDAAKVFHQADRGTERLTCQVIDGGLAVVELLVRYVPQDLVNQRVDALPALAHGIRAHLLVITDDDDFLAEREGHESHHVALAGLVDDDDVEACGSDVEGLDHPRERHDPDRHRGAALHQSALGLLLETRNVLSGALTDLLVESEPAVEGLLLLQDRSAAAEPARRASPHSPP